MHGDLHLGQTLRTAKGWKIVDFEGEPAKPLAERVRPDSPWRDVAGMLRSFDYAPAGRRDDGRGDRRQRHRAARLPGRRVVGPQPGGVPRGLRRPRDLTGDEQTLLAAYVADKAVYECVYEARNRPDLAADPAGRARARPPACPPE